MATEYPTIPEFPLSLSSGQSSTSADSVGGFFSLITSFFRPKVDFSKATSGAEIVRQGGTAEDVKTNGYTADDLKREDVKIDDFLWNSYKLEDLVHLGFSWEMLVDIGLRKNHLTHKNGMFVPKLLAEQLGVDGSCLQDVDFTIDNLQNLECTVQELALFKFTMDQLFDMGLDDQNFKQFGYTVREWSQFLGLTKQHVLDHFNFKKADFKEMGLGWGIIDLEKSLGLSKEELDELGMTLSMKFVFG